MRTWYHEKMSEHNHQELLNIMRAALMEGRPDLLRQYVSTHDCAQAFNVSSDPEAAHILRTAVNLLQQDPSNVNQSNVDLVCDMIPLFDWAHPSEASQSISLMSALIHSIPLFQLCEQHLPVTPQENHFNIAMRSWGQDRHDHQKSLEFFRYIVPLIAKRAADPNALCSNMLSNSLSILGVSAFNISTATEVSLFEVILSAASSDFQVSEKVARFIASNCDAEVMQLTWPYCNQQKLVQDINLMGIKDEGAQWVLAQSSRQHLEHVLENVDVDAAPNKVRKI